MDEWDKFIEDQMNIPDTSNANSIKEYLNAPDETDDFIATAMNNPDIVLETPKPVQIETPKVPLSISRANIPRPEENTGYGLSSIKDFGEGATKGISDLIFNISNIPKAYELGKEQIQILSEKANPNLTIESWNKLKSQEDFNNKQMVAAGITDNEGISPKNILKKIIFGAATQAPQIARQYSAITQGLMDGYTGLSLREKLFPLYGGAKIAAEGVKSYIKNSMDISVGDVRGDYLDKVSSKRPITNEDLKFSEKLGKVAAVPYLITDMVETYLTGKTLGMVPGWNQLKKTILNKAIDFTGNVIGQSASEAAQKFIVDVSSDIGLAINGMNLDQSVKDKAIRIGSDVANEFIQSIPAMTGLAGLGAASGALFSKGENKKFTLPKDINEFLNEENLKKFILNSPSEVNLLLKNNSTSRSAIAKATGITKSTETQRVELLNKIKNIVSNQTQEEVSSNGQETSSSQKGQEGLQVNQIGQNIEATQPVQQPEQAVALTQEELQNASNVRSDQGPEYEKGNVIEGGQDQGGQNIQLDEEKASQDAEAYQRGLNAKLKEFENIQGEPLTQDQINEISLFYDAAQTAKQYVGKPIKEITENGNLTKEQMDLILREKNAEEVINEIPIDEVSEKPESDLTEQEYKNLTPGQFELLSADEHARLENKFEKERLNKQFLEEAKADIESMPITEEGEATIKSVQDMGAYIEKFFNDNAEILIGKKPTRKKKDYDVLMTQWKQRLQGFKDSILNSGDFKGIIDYFKSIVDKNINSENPKQKIIADKANQVYSKINKAEFDSANNPQILKEIRYGANQEYERSSKGGKRSSRKPSTVAGGKNAKVNLPSAEAIQESIKKKLDDYQRKQEEKSNPPQVTENQFYEVATQAKPEEILKSEEEKTFLDDIIAAGEKAKERIKKRDDDGKKRGFNPRRGSVINPFEDLADYAIIGAAKIAKGIKTFKDFLNLPEFKNLKQEFIALVYSESQKVYQKNREAFINLNRIKTTESAKKAIVDAANENFDEIREFIGEKITNEEIIQRAKTAGILDKSYDQEQQLKFFAEIFNARKELVRLAESGKVTKELIEALQKVKSAGTFAGRLLQSQKIEADSISPQTMQMNEILQEIIDTGVSLDEILKASEGVDFNNQKEATEFYRKYIKPKISDVLDEYRYSNMLSSLATHIVNTNSNLIQAFILNPATNLLSGKNIPDYFKGIINAFPEAIREARTAFRGERILERPDIKRMRTNHPLVKWMYPITNALEASDVFFRIIIENGEIAQAIGNRTNISPKELKKIKNEASMKAAKVVFRESLDPENKSGQGHLLSALDKLTVAILKARDVKAVSWFVPFVQTPMSIFKQGIEYSPFGLTTLPGNINKKEQLAKTMIGSMVFMTSGLFALSGLTTWAPPTGEKEKEKFFASGRIPYSIKINGNWVSFSRLGPLALPMALAASIKWYVDENPKRVSQSTMERLFRSLTGIMQFWSDQSFLAGIGDLQKTVRGDVSALKDMTTNFIKQLVPLSGLQTWVANMIDPVFRKPDSEFSMKTLTQNVMKGIPFLSENVPGIKNKSGEEQMRSYPVLNAFVAFKLSKESSEGEKAYQKFLQEKESDVEKEYKKEQMQKYLINNEFDPDSAQTFLSLWRGFVSKKGEPVSEQRHRIKKKIKEETGLSYDDINSRIEKIVKIAEEK